MTASPAEKIDPAHWVSMAGGAVMMAVVCLCSIALMMPWWTENLDAAGQKENTEVTLWIRATRMELSADDGTLNCEDQCDFTKVGAAKVRETKVLWADACLEASGQLADNCSRIWIVRVGTIICWFMGLIFAALSTFNFCGAGLPSAVRMPPGIKMVLGVVGILGTVMALSTAGIMDIRLQPTPPGTEPPDDMPKEVRSVPLNGIGFVCVLAACFLSVVGVGIAFVTQYVLDHLPANVDIEKGKPLADVNRGKPPSLEHQVGVAPGKESEAMAQWIKDRQPPPQALGVWMTVERPT